MGRNGSTQTARHTPEPDRLHKLLDAVEGVKRAVFGRRHVTRAARKAVRALCCAAGELRCHEQKQDQFFLGMAFGMVVAGREDLLGRYPAASEAWVAEQVRLLMLEAYQSPEGGNERRGAAFQI